MNSFSSTTSSAIVLRQHQVWRGGGHGKGRRARAFTLVELMVAVALVLVLIIGVNEVFRLTSNTINVGQSLSNATRDQRAVKATLEEDFKSMAPDGPCLIITNKSVAAFRSREDEMSQVNLTDGTNTVGSNPLYQDLNGDGYAVRAGGAAPSDSRFQFVTGEFATPATPNSRARRVDTITFFIRKPGLHRQTSNYADNLDADNLPVATDVVGNATSEEAMVTYGHLRLPDNASTSAKAVYFEPGEPDKAVSGATHTNDNNKYYTQWVLGRSAILMAPESTLGVNETHFCAPQSNSQIQTLQPLSQRTNTLFGDAVGRGERTYLPSAPVGSTWVGIGGGQFKQGPYSSLVDVAGISMTDFGARLTRYIRDSESTQGAPTYPVGTQNDGMWWIPAPSTSYFDTGTTPPSLARETLSYRFNGNPFGQRGYTGADRNDLALTLAQTSPVLVPRCTNFIVEFAGDYITQVNVPTNPGSGSASTPVYGLATAPVPDGELDFTVFRGVKRIRWYGLPRYDGSGNSIAPASSTSTQYYGPVIRGGTGVANSNPAYLGVDQIVVGETYTDRARSSQNVSEVVPVSDLLCDAVGTNAQAIGRALPGTIAKFEKVIMTNATKPSTAPLPADNFTSYFDLNPDLGVFMTTATPGNCLAVQKNYADPGNSYNMQRANYVCAWQAGDPKPKLIRITMTLEDPNSRSGTGGQTYEYVFPVP